MSGQPGDVPTFVNDMIGPLPDEDEPPMHEHHPVRPNSVLTEPSITEPSVRSQPSCEAPPKPDIPRASDHACHVPDELTRKEPSKPF